MPTTKKQEDIFADCVLHQRAKNNQRFKYEYPSNGLPEVKVKSAPAQYAITYLIEREKQKQQ